MATISTPDSYVSKRSSRLRRGMFGGVLLSVLLIAFGLLRFPGALSSGGAAGVLNLVGDAFILAVYALVGVVGPLAADHVQPNALQQGILFGMALGFWFTAHILIGLLAPLSSSGNATLGLVEFGGLPVLFLLAGVRGTLGSGQIRGGVAAAMWSSIIGTLVWFIVVLLTYYLFIGTSQEARNLEADQVLADFARSGMSDLRAFIMQDYMGGGFFHMLISPIFAALVGAGGGLLARGWLRLRHKVAVG